MENAHKKSVELSVFIGCFAVLDNLPFPTTTYSPRLTAGVAALFREWGLKVSKFQSIQISYFAFSYSIS